MSNKLPPKPEIGEQIKVRLFNSCFAKGRVVRYIVDTPERWKVEIVVEAIGPISAPMALVDYYISKFFGKELMFEHDDLM